MTLDSRADLDYGATPGVPMSILSKTNRRVIGRGGIIPPVPATLADADTTWASLIHAVTEDKNAEQITVTLSVQQFNPNNAVVPFGMNGLTARVTWGVDGGFHTAFLDVGDGTSFSVQAASIKVDIQNAVLNRAVNPNVLQAVTPRVVSASLGVGDVPPGAFGGCSRTYFFSGVVAATDFDVIIPPFAQSLHMLPFFGSAATISFLNDTTLVGLGSVLLAVTPVLNPIPIPGLARIVRFRYTGGPINVLIVFHLKL